MINHITFSSSLHRHLLTVFVCFMLPIVPLSAQNWGFQYKILQEGLVEEQEHFGEALAISDSFMVAGSPFHNWDSLEVTRTFSAGAAFVYKRNGDGSLSFHQKLVSPEQQGATFFGNQVILNDTWLMISCPFGQDTATQGPAYQGVVYIYELLNDGLWSLHQTLTAPDAMVGAHFGISLSLDSEYLLVGANKDRRNITLTDSIKDAGAAYLFSLSQTDEWELVQKLVASDRKEDGRFGTKVDISGDYLAIGASGHEIDPFYFEAGQVYLFEKNSTSGLWEEAQILQDETIDFYENFGTYLSLSGSYLVVGIRSHDAFPGGLFVSKGGRVSVFHRENTGTWTLSQQIYNPDPNRDDMFGTVEIEGEILAIGSTGDDHIGTSQDSVAAAGAVHIYELLSNGQWSQRVKLTQAIRAEGDLLGFTLALHGRDLAVGSPYAARDSLYDAGAVFLFQREWAVATDPGTSPAFVWILENPSPALSLSLKLPQPEVWSMTLFSIEGKGLFTTTSRESYWHQEMAALPAGLYLVKVQAESGNQTTLRWVKTE